MGWVLLEKGELTQTGVKKKILEFLMLCASRQGESGGPRNA
jgi:hypothetical protein